MHLFAAVLLTAAASLPARDAPCLQLSCLSSTALQRVSSEPAPRAPCSEPMRSAHRGPLLVAAGVALIALSAWTYAQKDHEEDALAAGLDAMVGLFYGAGGAVVTGIGTYLWIQDARCERRDAA